MDLLRPRAPESFPPSRFDSDVRGILRTSGACTCLMIPQGASGSWGPWRSPAGSALYSSISCSRE